MLISPHLEFWRKFSLSVPLWAACCMASLGSADHMGDNQPIKIYSWGVESSLWPQPRTLYLPCCDRFQFCQANCCLQTGRKQAKWQGHKASVGWLGVAWKNNCISIWVLMIKEAAVKNSTKLYGRSWILVQNWKRQEKVTLNIACSKGKKNRIEQII